MSVGWAIYVASLCHNRAFYIDSPVLACYVLTESPAITNSLSAYPNTLLAPTTPHHCFSPNPRQTQTCQIYGKQRKQPYQHHKAKFF